MRRTPSTIAAVTALAAALTLTGCQSNSQRCLNKTCHVTVKGEGQTFEVHDYDLRVEQITTDSVLIQVEGAPLTPLKVGSRTALGPLTIQVTSISEDSVTFDATTR